MSYYIKQLITVLCMCRIYQFLIICPLKYLLNQFVVTPCIIQLCLLQVSGSLISQYNSSRMTFKTKWHKFRKRLVLQVIESIIAMNHFTVSSYI